MDEISANWSLCGAGVVVARVGLESFATVEGVAVEAPAVGREAVAPDIAPPIIARIEATIRPPPSFISSPPLSSSARPAQSRINPNPNVAVENDRRKPTKANIAPTLRLLDDAGGAGGGVGDEGGEAA